MTRSTHVSMQSPQPEKPIMRISRRRVWILAFIVATLFWLTVAALAVLAIRAVQGPDRDAQTATSSQAE